MAETKRYYWLRLHDDFFRSVRIKKLRRMAGGDTYVVIYLKMQLMAMKTDGVLTWRGYEQDFVEELAIALDEEPDNVRVTLAYLLSCGLAETSDKINFFLPYAVENTGSETSAAERMRNMRKRNNVTSMLQERYVEKEIEKEIDTRDRERGVIGGKTKFSPPTLEEVKAFCDENGIHIDVDYFFDHYTGNGWKVGKNAMKDWKATVRNWARRDREKTGAKNKTPYDGLRTETNGDDADRLAKMMGVQDG